MATANNNVVISRIQNRRGLKQDLPQPLREGEIGLALDSSQVYIGGDIDSSTSNISSFESTTSSVTLTQDVANTRIIHFTVPHKRLLAGHFDGVSTIANWSTSSNTYTGSGLPVFSDEITPVVTSSVDATVHNAVFQSNIITLTASNSYIGVGDVVTGNDITGTATVSSIDGANITVSSNQTLGNANTISFTPNNIKSISTNENFKASDITVVKNETVLLGDNANYTPATSKDYSFSTSTLASNTHVLNFRVAPLTSDKIAVTYYSNASVIKALSNSGVIYAGSSTNSFYTDYSVPTYRQLNHDLVRVSPSAGTGHIGLDYKHIAVFEDSTAVSNPTGLVLGNFLISDNSLKSTANVGISASGTTVTISTGSSNSPAYGNSGATYDFVYLTDLDSSCWLEGKALAVSNVQSSTMEVSLPSGNSVATLRAVTSGASGAGNAVTITGNVEGLVQGDYVYFTGSNASVFSANPYQVTGVSGTTSFTVVQSGVSEIAGDLNYINYGSDNTGGNIQLISSLHGLPVSSQIDLSSSSNTSAIANGTKTLLSTRVTNNTFFIPSTAAVVGDVNASFSPVLGSATVTHHTPINSIDLSNVVTLDNVISTFQGLAEFPNLTYIPGTTNQVYISTKASFDSLGSSTSGGVEFTLHEDSAGTMSALSLPIGSKTRGTHTIKAKLEQWLHNLVVDKNVPLFTSAQSNDKFYTSGTNLGTYTLAITNEDDNKFITFHGRDQASDFNHIVNQIYFKTANPDIKGLLNIRTNIELLTSESSGGGSKVTTFDDVESVAIPAAGNTTVATISTVSYDSYIIDYTVDFTGTSDGNYRRVGQLHASSFYNSSTGNATVVFRDDASEVADTVTGSVSFTAELNPANNTDIVVNAISTVNKITSMKYITRRWNS